MTNKRFKFVHIFSILFFFASPLIPFYFGKSWSFMFEHFFYLEKLFSSSIRVPFWKYFSHSHLLNKPFSKRKMISRKEQKEKKIWIKMKASIAKWDHNTSTMETFNIELSLFHVCPFLSYSLYLFIHFYLLEFLFFSLNFSNFQFHFFVSLLWLENTREKLIIFLLFISWIRVDIILNVCSFTRQRKRRRKKFNSIEKSCNTNSSAHHFTLNRFQSYCKRG